MTESKLPAKIKVDVNMAGVGTVLIDGMDISHCVHSVEFKSQASELTEVTLKIHGDLDANVEAKLEQIALKNTKPVPPDQTVVTADGRTLRVRHRTAN